MDVEEYLTKSNELLDIATDGRQPQLVRAKAYLEYALMLEDYANTTPIFAVRAALEVLGETDD